LKRWRAHLHWLCTHTNPAAITQTSGRSGYEAHLGIELKLEKIAPYLTRFSSTDIEIPGLYTLELKEPNQDSHAWIERFDSRVHVTYSHAYAIRRFGMIGSDGEVYHFTMQYTVSHITRAEERMNQMYVLLNYMMKKYVETRRRQLRYKVPLVVPLNPRLRLVESHPSALTLEDIYEHSSSVRGRDSDQPLLTWRQSLRQIAGGEQNPSARLKVYQDICAYQVPDTLLSQYMYRNICSSDQMWAFKKTFTTQIALTGLLCYLLRIGDRSLHKITLWRNSGQLIHSEFFPSYNPQGQIESNESVPMRLTRNITTFVGPHLTEGLLVASIMATNSAMIKNQEVIKNYLCLFVRDDLLSWNQINKLQLLANNPDASASVTAAAGGAASSSGASTSADDQAREAERLLREKVSNNVAGILKRTHMLLPSDYLSSRDKAAMTVPFASKVQQLVRVSVLKSKLALMPPTWQAYF
jgi:transformation/transcription domain-associated protein